MSIERTREQFIILLLGVVNRPIPTKWHIQKEIFILSQFNPKLKRLFRFEKHYEGPYSPVLQELIDEPLYFENPYVYNSQEDGYVLTKMGRASYKQIINEYEKVPNFSKSLHAMKLIRQVYDKLSKDELLFLVYKTYPDYIEFSNVYDKLIEDKGKGLELAKSIYKKGLVTEERYKELINNVIT